MKEPFSKQGSESNIQPDAEINGWLPSFQMNGLFASHRDPLFNTDDNYFMKSLIYSRICVLCGPGGWSGLL